MKSIGGALVLFIVLAVVGVLAMREMQGTTSPASAASGVEPSGPAERARAAKQRATEDVGRAMDAASVSRNAAEPR